MRAALLPLLSHAYAHRIKHVVVLYEENRAFDHLLGHQKALHVDGLKGTESNPIDRKDPSKGSVTVYDGAPYVAVDEACPGADGGVGGVPTIPDQTSAREARSFGRVFEAACFQASSNASTHDLGLFGSSDSTSS